MWASSEVKCPGCKFKNTITKFKPPSLFEPSVVQIRCTTCQSDILFKFVKPKKSKDRTQMAVFSKILKPSELLTEMLREDEEFKKKSIEEQEAIHESTGV